MGAKRKDPRQLSRRERQIMDVLYRRGEVTISDLLAELPNPPTDSAVRAALRLLEGKGWVSHRLGGQRNVYRPTPNREDAARSALQNVLDTFFAGARDDAVAAVMDHDEHNLTATEIERLQALIDRARARRNR